MQRFQEYINSLDPNIEYLLYEKDSSGKLYNNTGFKKVTKNMLQRMLNGLHFTHSFTLTSLSGVKVCDFSFVYSEVERILH